MNQYSQLLLYFKSLAESDNYINTVLKGDEIDWNKMDVYPLLNIEILTGAFTNGNTVTFNVDLQCLNIRDINKEVTSDKFWKQDNEVDNHNNTLAALNRIYVKMLSDFEDNNITITGDENPLTKVTRANPNILDGWELSFTVETPNTTLNICDGCN